MDQFNREHFYPKCLVSDMYIIIYYDIDGCLQCLKLLLSKDKQILEKYWQSWDNPALV